MDFWWFLNELTSIWKCPSCKFRKHESLIDIICLNQSSLGRGSDYVEECKGVLFSKDWKSVDYVDKEWNQIMLKQ